MVCKVFLGVPFRSVPGFTNTRISRHLGFVRVTQGFFIRESVDSLPPTSTANHHHHTHPLPNTTTTHIHCQTPPPYPPLPKTTGHHTPPHTIKHPHHAPPLPNTTTTHHQTPPKTPPLLNTPTTHHHCQTPPCTTTAKHHHHTVHCRHYKCLQWCSHAGARALATRGLNTFTSFDAPCHMTHRGGGVRALAHLCLTEGKHATKQKWRSANLKLCLEATISNV